MLISFSGASGAGKTTLIKKIDFQKLFPNKRIVYKKEDNFILISFFKKYAKKKIVIPYQKKKFYTNSSSQKNALIVFIDFLYPLLVYIEYLFLWFFYRFVKKNTVCILDRYLFDYSITFFEMLKIRNNFVKYFYKKIPLPDISFLIRINMETFEKRNKNNIPGKITTNKKISKDVLKSYDHFALKYNLFAIDNNYDLNFAKAKCYNALKTRNKLSRLKTISFSGIDGTGKTTVSKELIKYLTSLGIKCQIAHFFHDNLVYKSLIFLKLIPPPKLIKSEMKKNQVKVKKTFIKGKSLPWTLYTVFDAYLQNYYYRFYGINKITIFDRYFYDYLVSFSFLNHFGVKIIKKYIPKVNVSFVLTCSPITAYRRKPENVITFYQEAVLRYNMIAKNYKLKTLNTENKDSKVIVNEILKNI